MRLPTPKFPSQDVIDRAVQAIHDHPAKTVLAVTGAFTGLQQILWDVPGASKTFLGNYTTYDQAETDRFLGEKPNGYCNAATARLLARQAYRRACQISKGPVLGLGATATVVTDRPKKGSCRLYVSIVDSELEIPRELELTDLQAVSWDRRTQGRLSDLFALNCLLEALEIERLDLGIPSASMATSWQPYIAYHWDGSSMRHSLLDPQRHALFPGSFYPIHEGHIKLTETTREVMGKETIMLIEQNHPVKGNLSDDEIAKRIIQCHKHRLPVLVTRGAGLYTQKARLFPGFSFLIGADTALRICDRQYYDPEHGGLQAAFQAFADCNTRFYVVDRIDDGHLRSLNDKAIPDAFRKIATRLDGRWDISSTQLRQRKI